MRESVYSVPGASPEQTNPPSRKQVTTQFTVEHFLETFMATQRLLWVALIDYKRHQWQ